MKWIDWIMPCLAMLLVWLITGCLDRYIDNSQKWECAAHGGEIIPRETLSPQPKTDVCLKKQGGA